MTTFKIERIEAAELKLERFDLPTDFDEQELLRYAWGIWSSEGEPENVRLKFFPGAATRRLRESKWHPTEEVTEQEDGSLIWEAQVAEWHEMIPWVRGWGADVEVLLPLEMRKALKKEVQELESLYSIGLNIEPARIYYAHSKEGLDQKHWQRLKDHLINTSTLALQLGRDAGVADLAYIAGLFHDIGKYSLAFQGKLEGSKRFVDHSTAGAQEIIQLFQETPQSPLAGLLAYCIAGHHAGLPDGGSLIDLSETGTLKARLKANLEDFSAYKTETKPNFKISRTPSDPADKNIQPELLAGIHDAHDLFGSCGR